MKIRICSVIIPVSILLAVMSCTQVHYCARDFFEDAELEYISAEETISQSEKDAIIRSGFVPGSSSSGPFSLISVEPDRLQLRDVDIHVYHRDGGGNVVSVTSILGNHDQNQFSRFFEINGSGEIAGELDRYQLGISEVLSNEFLDPDDFFTEEDNYPVALYILDDGSFRAEPWTWMNPHWEGREIVYEIVFTWNGELFTKEVKRLQEQ